MEEPPSSARSHTFVIAPLVPLLFCILAAGWYYSEIDAFTGGQTPADACTYEHPAERLEASCNHFGLAVGGTTASLVLAFVCLTCFSLWGALQKLTAMGAISLTLGARVGYWLALAASFAGILLYPAAVLIGAGLPVLHVAGATHLWLDLLLVGLALCGSCYCVWKVFEAHPPAYDLLTLPLSGKVSLADEQPGVYAILQRICNTTRLPMPDQVIYGLEANIDCTRRPVSLDGKPVRGLTLYVALPLCRLLSEDELAALITCHIARCELVPTELEAWIINHCSKWQVTRRGGSALWFAPLWQWVAQWDHYLSGTILLAMQRATLVSGRSNTAAAIAIRGLTYKRWAAFENQAQSRFRADGELVNLSEAFALEMTRGAEELADSYLEVDESGVHGHALLTRLLHAEPEEVRERILAGPAGQALDCCFAGGEQMELELSSQQLRHSR